jgi:GAF domain-containing protein
MGQSPTAFLRAENVRLKEENENLKEELNSLREFVKILDTLADASKRVQSDAELLPMLNDIFLKAMNLLNAPDGSLVLLDEDKNELVFVLVHGALASDLTGYRIPADVGIAGWVMQNLKPALVRDVRYDTRFSHMIDEEFKFRTQSIAAAPLVGNEKVYGVIEALNQPGDEPFSESDMALLNLLCRFAGEALADIEHHPSTTAE